MAWLGEAFGACAGCIGLSGTFTSSNSSCETARIVNASVYKCQCTLEAASQSSVVLTNSNGESENCGAGQDVLDEKGLSRANQRGRLLVVLVIVRRPRDTVSKLV